MPLHRIILRLMLWSLGLAAIAGVGAVLTGGDDTVARVLGTSLTTAGAALLLYPLSRMIDKAKWRAAGTFGMGLVVVEYIIVLSLIWEFGDLLPGSRSEEELLLTMLNFAATGVAAIVMLRRLHNKDSRLACVVGLAVAAVVAIVWLAGTWIDSNYDDECGASGFILGGFGIVVVLSLVGAGTDRRHWRWVGVACSAAATVMALVGVWMNYDDPSDLFVILATLGVLVGYANIVLRVPLKSGQHWLVMATIATAIGTGALLDLLIILLDGDSDPLFRLVAAGMILTACGSLALMVLARLNRGVELEAATTDITEITIVCPRCRKKQDLPIGPAACGACGLRITTRVEEPTCPGCGYLLLHLTSDTCPECGRPISQHSDQ
jgi:hypothetical protein